MTARKIDTGILSANAQKLSKTFARRIVGQPEAVTAFNNVLEKYMSGFYDKRRPISTLLFLGPTGTGKTSATEAFVEGLFGKPDFFIKIDCGEFQHSHDIAKLTGSPPGYLGHRETSPMITNARIQMLRTPEIGFTVLLFDEIEKASDGLWNILLGIMDKGQMTLGTNEVVDLTKTVIVMTSNVGSREMAQKSGDGVLGFLTPTADEVQTAELKDISVAAARRKFQPEFLNRIDETVMFNTLSQEDISNIFWLEMGRVHEMIAESGSALLTIFPSPAAVKKIINEGYDKKYNARNLKRVIDRLILTPVARAVSTQQAVNGDKLIVDYDEKDGEWSYYAEAVVPEDPLKRSQQNSEKPYIQGMAGNAGVVGRLGR